MAGTIIIDSERCKGCGLCVTACMKDCIILSQHTNQMGYFPAQLNGHACTGCARCAVVCPDAAIQVRREEPISIKETVRPHHPVTLLKEQV